MSLTGITGPFNLPEQWVIRLQNWKPAKRLEQSSTSLDCIHSHLFCCNSTQGVMRTCSLTHVCTASPEKFSCITPLLCFHITQDRLSPLFLQRALQGSDCCSVETKQVVSLLSLSCGLLWVYGPSVVFNQCTNPSWKSLLAVCSMFFKVFSNQNDCMILCLEKVFVAHTG